MSDLSAYQLRALEVGAKRKEKEQQHKAKSKKGGKAPKLARAPEVGPNERPLYLERI